MPVQTVSIEIWLPVVGFAGLYEVSNLGRVRSLRRHQPKLLRPGRMTAGHLSVSLGRGRSRTVHSLVIEAFVGPRPPGMEVRHSNGVPSDNRLANLAYGTRADNSRDKKWHSPPTGPRKLSGEQASAVKARLQQGAPRRDLRREFGLSAATLSAIARGKIHADA